MELGVRDKDSNSNERLRGQRGLDLKKGVYRKNCLECLNTINAKGMSGTADGGKKR